MNLTHSLLVIFSIIFIGMACEKRKVFNSSHIEGFEIFLFKVLMPCYLFTATLHYDFKTLLNLDFLYSYLLSFAFIGFIIIFFYAKRNTFSEVCIKILTAGYVNSAMYSLPVITFLLNDPKAAILGNLIQVIIIQTAFVTLLSFSKHKEKSIGHKLWTSFSTPLVIMPILGLLCNYAEFNLHPVLLAAIKNLGSGASGIALFTFGLTLGSIKVNRGNINSKVLGLVLVKTIIHPFIAFMIGAHVFALEKYWLHALVLSTSAPTAFLVYLIAKQNNVNQEPARMAVAISSVTSLLLLIVITFAIE